MKKLQLLLVSIAMLSMFSCSDDDDDTLGVWYRRSDFDGRAREDAAGFVIDMKLKFHQLETKVSKAWNCSFSRLKLLVPA